MKKSTFSFVLPCLILAGAAAQVHADSVYETEDPFGSFFGLVGFDVSTTQSVATRFTADGNYTLDSVHPWFMNNSETTMPEVTFTLRTNLVTEEGSFPSDEILESWTFNVNTLGWVPVQETLESVLHPQLEDGEDYWLVAESEAPPLENAVWLWAHPGNGWMSTCDMFGGGECEWSPAGTGAVVAVTVIGTPAEPGNPADLDGDGSVGVPDLLILLSAWGTCADGNNCPADLDGDGSVGVPDLLALLGNWG